jgi:hypothetical protein
MSDKLTLKFLAWCKSHSPHHPKYKLALELLLRPGELCGLERWHVNPTTYENQPTCVLSVLGFYGDGPKTSPRGLGQMMTVPLIEGAEAYHILCDLKALNQPYLFSENGKQLTTNRLNIFLRNDLAKWTKTLSPTVQEEVPDMTFHSWRRKGASMLFNTGVALYDIAALGRWRSTKTLVTHYMHPERLRLMNRAQRKVTDTRPLSDRHHLNDPNPHILQFNIQ